MTTEPLTTHQRRELKRRLRAALDCGEPTHAPLLTTAELAYLIDAATHYQPETASAASADAIRMLDAAASAIRSAREFLA